MAQQSGHHKVMDREMLSLQDRLELPHVTLKVKKEDCGGGG